MSSTRASTSPPISSSYAPSSAPVSASTQPSPSHHLTSSLPDWTFSSNLPTLHHVPKGARNSWADIIFSTLSAINQYPKNLENWKKLFMLPRCVLSSPGNGDRLGWKKLQSIVNLRFRRWNRGELSELWHDYISSISNQHRHKGGGKRRKDDCQESLQSINARRAKRAA